MKRYENVKMVLFDSTNAFFKLAVEAQFVRKGPDGNYRDLVYTTDRGTGVLNPNIYLTLSYKDDNMNAVYTSYPQLFQIRAALEEIKTRLLSGDAFITDPNDNSLSLKQNYADSIVLDNIGKSNNWIEFKLCVIKTGENGVYNYAPGVAVQLSTSNGFVSQLSQEEFLTVYTIIRDLNLSTIQCLLSLGFLNGDRPIMNGYNNGGYGYNPQPQQYPQQNNYGGYSGYNSNGVYQQSQTQPQFQQQQTPYMKPRYQGQQRTPSYRTQPVPPAPAGNNVVQQNLADQHPVDNPYPSQPVTNNNLKPRSTTPIMNPQAIADTPVSTYDIDDSAALDSIFGDNE